MQYGNVRIGLKYTRQYRKEGAVDFHSDNLSVKLSEKLCHCARARADFQNGVVRFGAACFGNTKRYFRLEQEILSVFFLWLNTGGQKPSL